MYIYNNTGITPQQLKTARWRGAPYAVFVSASSPVFSRNVGFFGYYYYNGIAHANYGSRASVVCGAGLLYKKIKSAKNHIYIYNNTGITPQQHKTARWRGATSTVFVSASSPVFGRGSGLFGCSNYVGVAGAVCGSRASVVCGAGL